MKTFYFLIIVLFGVNTYSQDILTIGEVFDYEIGNEFHYTNFPGSAPPNATRITIINKYFSENHDTVFYTRDHNNYSADVYYDPELRLEYSFWKDTTTVYYSSLDRSIFKYYANVTYDTIYKYWGSSEWFYYDSIVETSSWHCDIPVNGFSCNVGEFEPDYYEYEFGKGIGLTKARYRPGYELTFTNDMLMTYYSKGDKSCGSPDLTTGVFKTFEKNNIYIFPNPSKNEIFIQNDNNSKISDIFIFDMQGRLLKSTIYNPFEAKIDISDFINGVYIIKLNVENRIISKIILKQ